MRWRLLEEGVLVLVAHGDVADLVRSWLPRNSAPITPTTTCGAAARIEVRWADVAPAPAEHPEACIEMLRLRGWVEDVHRVSLRTVDGALGGVVDLENGCADIGLSAAAWGKDSERDLFWTLTVAAALLLGRRHRILCHAAATVAPDGSAWLLVGGTHSGKSTTCVNLIRHGWDYLADDQVVVRAAPDGTLRIEGWLRPFHVDDGLLAGRSTGRRSRAEPTLFGAGAWRQGAPLGGILFPTVEAHRASRLTAMGRAVALQQLIRHSPWLLADAVAAPEILARMLRMASAPCYRLHLGDDVFSDPAGLVRLLAPALSGNRHDAVPLEPVSTSKRTHVRERQS